MTWNGPANFTCLDIKFPPFTGIGGEGLELPRGMQGAIWVSREGIGDIACHLCCYACRSFAWPPVNRHGKILLLLYHVQKVQISSALPSNEGSNIMQEEEEICREQCAFYRGHKWLPGACALLQDQCQGVYRQIWATQKACHHRRAVWSLGSQEIVDRGRTSQKLCRS